MNMIRMKRWSARHALGALLAAGSLLMLGSVGYNRATAKNDARKNTLRCQETARQMAAVAPEEYRSAWTDSAERVPELCVRASCTVLRPAVR